MKVVFYILFHWKCIFNLKSMSNNILDNSMSSFQYYVLGNKEHSDILPFTISCFVLIGNPWWFFTSRLNQYTVPFTKWRSGRILWIYSKGDSRWNKYTIELAEWAKADGSSCKSCQLETTKCWVLCQVSWVKWKDNIEICEHLCRWGMGVAVRGWLGADKLHRQFNIDRSSNESTALMLEVNGN